MAIDQIPTMTQERDYSLIGKESIQAVQAGLAEAEWYQSPVPRAKMKELLERRNWPAIRDTFVWFGLLFGSGYLFFILWGSWWAILPYIVYSVIYASSSDSRWHESSHGTAFKSDWMNNALYEISSFMVFRQSITWRWSHTRHHSDTIIRGRDPEIAVPRPPDVVGMILQLFAIKSTPVEFKKIVKHAFGKIDPEVATYVPKEDFKKVFIRARIYLLIYAVVIGLSLYYWTLLPLFYIGLPTLFGSWLMVVYGTTQHAGLAENVLDHRLNCRTVYMNFVNRYLYWNMNYHVEHHMFPLVPYHALPKLHALIKSDLPKPYNGLVEAYKEIIPTVLKQVKDPEYHVKREIPNEGKNQDNAKNNVLRFTGLEDQITNGWIKVCQSDDLELGDVARFDLADKTFAIYKTSSGLFATEGICTHGSTHLAEGVIIGDQIECPKHNGRFSVKDGSVKRAPVCLALKTYSVELKGDSLFLKVDKSANEVVEKTHQFEVVSNDNVATYIKELTLKPISDSINYEPGDYIQLDIPAYVGHLRDVKVEERFKQEWINQGIFDMHVENYSQTRRNYSIASNPATDEELKFNVRLATPPGGVDCNPGLGSSYVFNLKKGDMVTSVGPFGDFHIKPTNKEMVYIGGGAGMAPLRSHLSHLFESLQTNRKVSFWYGARSFNEVFYQDYFEQLAQANENFDFTLALSEVMEKDQWTGEKGYIHQVAFDKYLKNHEAINALEFYLCGPPVMIEACRKMLTKLGVAEEQIAYDEF